MAFTKLFSEIVRSTIWREPDTTRILWITMLAICDRDGVVGASVPGLADTARISLEACLGGLKSLQEPDEWSRSQDHEGRRIEVVEGGWRILNYGKYRERFSTEDRREYKRVKQAEYRSKKKVAGVGVTRAGRLWEKANREGDLGTAQRVEEMEAGALAPDPAAEAFREKVYSEMAKAAAEGEKNIPEPGVGAGSGSGEVGEKFPEV